MPDEKNPKDELTEEDLTLTGASTLGDDDASPQGGGGDEDEDEDGSGSGSGQQTFVTREGLRKLKEELEQLETVTRKDVAQRLKEAISFGDLSENSEYEDAKNEQALIENRIAELKGMIKTAKIITEKKSSGKVVKIGSTVKIQNLTDKDEAETYTIVGATEANPAEAKISNESPIGAAIIDQVQGSEVRVRAPAGEMKYKILKVS